MSSEGKAEEGSGGAVMKATLKRKQPTKTEEDVPEEQGAPPSKKQSKYETISFLRSDKLSASKHLKRRMRESIPATRPEFVISMGRFWFAGRLPWRHRNRLLELNNIFLTPEIMEHVVVPLVAGHALLSLRAIDWLIINYSKKFKMVLVKKNGHILNVYDSYRDWLSYWKRSLFDAFRRGPRLFFDYEGERYSTTVGQLNFIYWGYKTDILRYALRHSVEIMDDMKKRIMECKLERKRLPSKKRFELSQAPDVKCMIYNVPVNVSLKP